MKIKLPSLWLGLLAACWLPAAASAQSEGGVDDVPPAGGEGDAGLGEVIPQPLPDSRYAASWGNNPFLKEVVTENTNAKVSWEKDWALSSMFKSETGKIIIGLQNRQTNEFKQVSNQDGPEAEFRLISANFNRNRNLASVEIARGNEKAVLTYDESLTSKPVTVNSTFQAPAAKPGAPGQPVNVAPAAGAPGQPANVPPGTVTGGAPVINRPTVPSIRSPQARPSAAPSPPTISRRRNLVPVPTPPPAQ